MAYFVFVCVCDSMQTCNNKIKIKVLHCFFFVFFFQWCHAEPSSSASLFGCHGETGQRQSWGHSWWKSETIVLGMIARRFFVVNDWFWRGCPQLSTVFMKQKLSLVGGLVERHFVFGKMLTPYSPKIADLTLQIWNHRLAIMLALNQVWRSTRQRSAHKLHASNLSYHDHIFGVPNRRRFS